LTLLKKVIEYKAINLIPLVVIVMKIKEC